MKKFYFLVLVLLLAMVPLENVHAKGGGHSWLLGFDVSYLADKNDSTVSGNTSTTTDYSTTFLDVDLGYMMGGLYVGGLYSSKSYKDNTDSSSTTGTAVGASVGWVFDSGVHLTGSYILSATDGNYKKGTGMQVDLGWRSYLSSSFYLGAKLAYRSVKYTENENVSGFESLTDSRILPYVSLGFGF